MADEGEMDGQFLGGGYIDYVVQNGEIFLSAKDLGTVFQSSGMQVGRQALAEGDRILAAQAQSLIVLGMKTQELRSELLKQEIEKSL